MPLPRLAYLLLPLMSLSPRSLAQSPETLRSREARASAKVVVDYYRARDHFNTEKARALEAPGLVFIGRDGVRQNADPNSLLSFMSYEKAMHGHWRCRVLGFQDGLLEAEITEENDYYRYLGSGKRIEIERFRIVAGKIQEMIDVSVRYTGRDQDSAYHDFIEWLLRLPESERPGVLRDGKLVFNEDGAHRQLPLLKRFHSQQSATSAH